MTAYTDGDVQAARKAYGKRHGFAARFVNEPMMRDVLDAVAPAIVARAKAEAMREAATLVDDAARQELGMGAAERSILRRADEIEAL